MTTATARPATTPKYANVSKPTVFGIYFEAPDSDSLFGLTCLRWTSSLYFDQLHDGAWTSIRVVNPERFTLGQEINTTAQWKAVVDRWFAWKSSDEQD
jgi:hypothetical protein